MSELKGCPFCGERPTLIETVHLAGNYWHVVCDNNECGEVSTDGKTEAEAITAWNTRPAPTDGEVERLRAALEAMLSKEMTHGREMWPEVQQARAALGARGS